MTLGFLCWSSCRYQNLRRTIEKEVSPVSRESLSALPTVGPNCGSSERRSPSSRSVLPVLWIFRNGGTTLTYGRGREATTKVTGSVVATALSRTVWTDYGRRAEVWGVTDTTWLRRVETFLFSRLFSNRYLSETMAGPWDRLFPDSEWPS